MRGVAIAGALLLAAMASAVAQQPPVDTTKRAPSPEVGPVLGLRRPPPSEGDQAPRRDNRARTDPDPVPRSVPGAAERLRLGGRRFTSADFERLGATHWMDVASQVPNTQIVTVQPKATNQYGPNRFLEMTGVNGRCRPTVFINEQRWSVTEADWDHLIQLDRLEAIEVYSQVAAPIMFRPVDGVCGTVILWTKWEI